MQIVKTSGEIEQYDSRKLCDSLMRSGLETGMAQNICQDVEQNLKPGVTTSTIFREALGRVIKEDAELAARYSLRRALYDLGPAGFLFEAYIEVLLQVHGYETQRNVFVEGGCIRHEIDVLAKKNGVTHYIEAKYKNEPGIKTHIDKVMYADARFMDIQNQARDTQAQIWVITNTKFTQLALEYGRCKNMQLIGWSYPAENSLQHMIISKKLYPVTVLPSVSHHEREMFAQKGVLLAQDLFIYSEEQLGTDFGITKSKAKKIRSEVEGILRE